MSEPPAPAVIRAAGCVLWRRVPRGIEVALIHRPKYDDWSWPKGKLDDGERAEDAALRELTEETGHTGMLGDYLCMTEYTTMIAGTTCPKTVHYWEVEAQSGTFVTTDEVDVLRWLPVGDARRLLTQERDRTVLDTFTVTVPSQAADGSAH